MPFFANDLVETQAPGTSGPHRPVVLVNEAAIDLPLDDLTPEGAQVIVAGQSLVRMTLAELSLPGAQMIWTDLRQSASLRNVHSTVQSLGGLDRLVLAGDGHEGEAMFSIMCAILTFLPALRRRPRSRILLTIQDGPGVDSLREFLSGLAPRLERDGIRVTLQIDRTVISVAA